MSIKESLGKIKSFYGLVGILLVALIFFILGRFSISEVQKTPINITYSNTLQSATVALSTSTEGLSGNTTLTASSSLLYEDGPVIGSKSGKKYYFPWCGTVKRIKPENQVKFNSIKEARDAGFVAGGNCKGLK